MSGALFGRRVEVLLGTVARPALARYGNTDAAASPLRIAFSVKKGLKSSPNISSVTLWNMTAEHRAIIKPSMVVTLSAGYAKAGLQTLSIGVVDKVTSKRDGSAVSTVIECLDGVSAITQATLVRAYPAGTQVLQVFRDLAAAMQTRTAANPTGIVGGAIVGVDEADTLTAPYSCQGMVRDILTELCRPRGLEWSLQNGGLTIVPLAGVVGQTAVAISERSGMTGIPSLNKELLTFESLLNPAIQCGATVFVDSRAIQGYFKVRGGTWEGDTHGDKWTCSIEAVSLPAIGSGDFRSVQLLQSTNEGVA